MEWSDVEASPVKQGGGTPEKPLVPTLDHNRLFMAYATPTVPKSIENKKSKNIAQSRLQRLQNALRQEQQKVPPPPATVPKPTKSPVKSPPAQSSRKRKATEESSQVAEKKRGVEESIPGACKRVFLKATRAKNSVQDRLKRIVAKPSSTETTTSSTTSSNWFSCVSKTQSSPEAKSPGRKTKHPSEEDAGALKRVKISQNEICSQVKDTTSTKTATETHAVPSNVPDISLNLTPSFKNDEDGNKDLSDSFYVVVDTNIFCHNLIFVNNLLNMKSCNAGYPILVIPYIVLQELDNIKHQNSTIEANCNKAIKFINVKLQSRHAQVKGQSAIDESDYKIQPMSNDDSIINCCLQVKEKTPRVILLTNDCNLRNKAICNKINALRPKDLREDVAVEFL